MKELFEAIINNHILVALIASPLAIIVIGTIYQALMRVVLSEKNIHKLAGAIDKMVDKMEKRDPASAKLTRTKLISICQDIIDKLKDEPYRTSNK